MATNDNTFSKSSIKGNKLRPFKTRWLGKGAISKLWRSKRAFLVVMLLALSAVALVSLGIRRAIRPAPSLATVNAAVKSSEPPATIDLPLTKLREYVYAGGRLITSEEKSCVPTLNPVGANLPQGGGTGSFNVSTSSGCNWSGASSASWITVTGGSSGTGNGSLSYVIAANSGAQRVGTITINGQAFTITQAPNPTSCSYALNKTSESISEQGGNGSLALTTGGGCPWTASSSAGWLTVTSATSGSGPATISYSVAANGGQQRVGAITVGGQTFTVTQAPNQASCTFVLNPSSWLYSVEGGSGSFSVTTGTGCRWDAATSDGWITITGGATGIGNGTVSFTVQANNGVARIGSISVRGQVFTITQCGGYEISPTSASFAEDGGADSVTVSSAAGCSWVAASNVGWITIISGANGSGNGSVNYSVPSYGTISGHRYGTLTVAGRTVTIDQVGPPRPPREEEDLQMGMLLPPGSDAGPKTTKPQPSALSRWLANPLSRAGLAFLITCGALALLLWIKLSVPQRRRGRRDFAEKEERLWSLLAPSLRFLSALCASAVRWVWNLLALSLRFLKFCGASAAPYLARLVALLFARCRRLLPERVRTIARQALSSWRSSGVARLKVETQHFASLHLRRALVIALIVRLAAPLSPAEADGLVRAAQATWREAGATANRYGAGIGSDLINRSIETALGGRRGKVVSAASQAEQVTDLQVCPRQLIMFVGECYTLTPIAMGSTQQVVHGAGMNWSSLEGAIAKVSSFGEVEAMAVGTTAVEVRCGSASKQIPIEVRNGTRPTGSNQQADLDTTADCAAEQASMYAPQSAAVASAQQDLIGGDGVSFDWDPAPVVNSLATNFRNAVGNPRFAARSRGVQLGSDNYKFNVPVVSVGGRGVSASIGMTLNSRVWNNDNGKLTFNYIGAYPAPGWSMGYGKIIRNYNSTATGDSGGVGGGNSPGDYLLVAGDGTRIRLVAKYDAATGRWLHESDDGSFLQFDPRRGEMRSPDGARTVYSSVNGCLLPTAMIGTNGGAITMSYRDYCEGVSCTRVFRHRTALNTVRDTLGRYVTFHYYGDIDYTADPANGRPAGELAAIKAPDRNGVQQEVIRVEYQPITLKYDFGGLAVDAPANNSQIQVVRRIYYPQTGRGFLFLDYSSYGMPRKISTRLGMTGAGGTITDGVEMAYTTYNYTTIDPNDPYGRNQMGSLSDFPQFTRREEWWQGKTDAAGVPTTATTKYDYSRTTDASTEVATIKYVDWDYEEATTTGTDSSQLSFGKVISVERRTSSPPQATLGKQVLTYVTGPDGEVEIEKIETFDEAGQGRLLKFGYGNYGRVSDRYECGYKQAGGYQVIRRTHYDYIDDQSYLTARFLRLVSRTSAYDAKNNNDPTDDLLMAKTETTYDGYTDPAIEGIENYVLTSGQYPPNHDATYDQNKTLRGNATAVKTFSQLNPAEVSTTRHSKYDIFGNVVWAEVSCCVKKSFSFSGVTAYSEPDSALSGDTGGLNLQTTYQYNYFTGLVENETDPDGQPTAYDYDLALRLKTVTSPTGAFTVTQFDQDSNGNDLLTYLSQTTYGDQGTQKVITSRQWFDGAGRVIRAGTGAGSAPDSYDMTATVYDGFGRVAKQSNPYPGDADGNPQSGVTLFWTVNAYDRLSRVIKVTLPDQQFIQTDYSGATPTSGATVVATDTVRRKRKGEVDGLGRLVKVTEQNPANGNLEWETSYSYDALDNLTQVNQGGQLRTFTHDAKSRLIRNTTPESGKTTYTYTDFDAVSTRTDERGVVTTYTYGPLNLLTGVSYNTASATGVATTAPVSITYKSDSPGKGQAKTVTDGAGSESYGYDSFGRLQSCTRVIDGINYQKQYEYNTVNQMTLMTYPSGKRMNVGRDDRGRLSAVKRVDVSGAPQETYLSGINYRADWQISSQTLGNGATESFGYSDDRLQPTSQTVTKGGNTLLSLSYGYGASAGQMGFGTTSGNSGQLISVNGTINGQGRNQAFTYDNVSRLVTATGWGAWARRFDYDRYGNRTGVWDAVSGGNPLQNTALEQVGGIKTNRIASVNGTAFSYDASGNVTVNGASTYTSDAENRIMSVSGAISESYGYDAGNRRVKKVVGGVVTHYVWEGGQVIAEYERGGGATQATGTRYYHQDRLSTRVITDGAGAVVGTTDHLPFGEEIGVSGEGEKHKFTTYERDGTLDYAVNRHYDPRQGRFNQVDPLGMGASNLADPQSLNLYAYSANDPVNYTDPSGMEFERIGREVIGGDQGGYSGGGRGGSGGSTCYIDGFQSSCGLAFGLLQSGAAVIGPSETTRWNPNLFKGQGGFEHFRVDANGNVSWGYYDSVRIDALDDKGNVIYSNTLAEWHETLRGKLTAYHGGLAVDTSGLLRDIDGSIIGERPIEMQMLGPLDAIGPAELKAGTAVLAGILAFSRIGLKSVAKDLAAGTLEVTVRSEEEAAEIFLRVFQGRGYRNTTGMTGNMVRNDKFLFPDGKYGTYHWDFADTMHGGVPHLQIHPFKEEGGGIIRIFFPR